MNTEQKKPGKSLPPHAQLILMCRTYWVPRMLYAAATLGLADQLAAGPKSAAELAKLTHTQPAFLYRLLRALAGLGLFTEGSSQQFALTPLGAALQKNAPGAAYSTVLTLASPWFAKASEQLLHTVQTGETGFETAFGVHFFDYLAQDPERVFRFSETMVGVHGAEPAAVAAAYDFSQFATIMDVGGATGNMLAAILKHHAQPRGVLFDMPQVVRDAQPLLKKHGIEQRVSIEAGSFFEGVPAGADAYLLSHIIHDWSEDRCLTILNHCRKAMKPDGKLLIIETVIPPGDAPHPGKMQDIAMMVLSGGQERTEAEYASLLARAGLRLSRVVPTASEVSVVEVVLA
ncbi:MAG: hydroxyneurosporene-O-methyltransferase [Gammaproteobacteria bacterium]|nr:methyltransferase [Gammaproteobacteria bacterium]MCE7901682.1 methyltransferase [Gammaproteobacteria bacterium PRO9]MDL1880585.1 methyltransferase [Gammaproteobacteria bacterium PRO2]MCL4777180.1 methyltransferase [Gammaproteobacteria bacterium]MCQ3935120.1 methyltransferase [Gammaproteobacteria bacterium]